MPKTTAETVEAVRAAFTATLADLAGAPYDALHLTDDGDFHLRAVVYQPAGPDEKDPWVDAEENRWVYYRYPSTPLSPSGDPDDRILIILFWADNTGVAARYRGRLNSPEIRLYGIEPRELVRNQKLRRDEYFDRLSASDACD